MSKSKKSHTSKPKTYKLSGCRKEGVGEWEKFEMTFMAVDKRAAKDLMWAMVWGPHEKIKYYSDLSLERVKK